MKIFGKEEKDIRSLSPTEYKYKKLEMSQKTNHISNTTNSTIK